MPASAEAKPIVSLCLAAFAGADRAAVNLALTSGLSRHITLSSPDAHGAELEFTIAHLREQRPVLVMFHGWSPAYAVILAALRRQSIAFAVDWHSSPGQTDMAGECTTLATILGERRIGHLLFANEALRQSLASHVPDTHHLPNTLAAAEWRPHRAADRPPSSRRRAQVTLFAQRDESARKNVTGCLLALGLLRRRPTLQLNGLSRERPYRKLLDRLHIPYREWGRMTRDRYDAVVRAAAVGLQASFAETYGYVVAEHLARGVPVVGSPAVPVLARLSPPLRRRLVVSNPDDPREIADKLGFLLDHPDRAAAIGARARVESARANQRDITTARAVLRAVLARPRLRRR